MARSRSFRRSLASMLFWSVISAAFIGPGTVTTAAKAGSGFGLQLLWALIFSVIATIFLQEAAARITIASGKSLGEVLAQRFGSRAGHTLRIALFLAVAFGCAAYQTGNLLGALSGFQLVLPIPTQLTVIAMGLIAASLLYSGDIQRIARSLSVLVALMGLLFVWLAIRIRIPLADLLQPLTELSLPSNGTLLVTALIGTTIVPYNLFLASGISHGQSVREMRVGIILAIAIGGLISIAILIVGTLVPAPFSFEGLFALLNDQLGPWAGPFFGVGLFAAGLSSAITAPLAAAVTGSSLLGHSPHWKPRGRYFRLTWISILTIGLLFALLQIKPVPAIVLAQAINGVLLPLVAAFLYLAVNDRQVLGNSLVNSPFANAILLLITGLAIYLGIHNLFRALQVPATPRIDLLLKPGLALIILAFIATIAHRRQS